MGFLRRVFSFRPGVARGQGVVPPPRFWMLDLLVLVVWIWMLDDIVRS